MDVEEHSYATCREVTQLLLEVPLKALHFLHMGEARGLLLEVEDEAAIHVLALQSAAVVS